MRGSKYGRKRRRGGRVNLPFRTIAFAATLALIVAIAGLHLSRQIDLISERPAGNQAEDAFAKVVRRIDGLEQLWEVAIDAEAKRMLEHGLSSSSAGDAVAGVVQRSVLSRNFNDSARQHQRADGRAPVWRPVLESFSRKEAGEWVLAENEVMTGAGWIEMAGRPLAWWSGNGRSVAVLLLDPGAAARVAQEELASDFADDWLGDESDAAIWSGPGELAWMTRGHPNLAARPDESLRHLSRFGDWTLQRYYPSRQEIRYQLPVLAGSFAVAVLLLGGGAAVASWQRKAIRLAEERVSFVNQVSHELRTPLTNLLLNTDLALDALPEEDQGQRRRLGLIREETGRLSRIVDNVLAFARIEEGNGESRRVSCDLGNLIDELRENFEPLFKRRSIVCQYDGKFAGVVRLDRDALAQILSNLLSNVEKYAGEGASARVSVAAEGGSLLAEVRDDGPGIPGEARQRVFLPFERAGSSVNEGATGTGLGLAISRELAERMGGRLELVPAAVGAWFRLLIPIEERNDA